MSQRFVKQWLVKAGVAAVAVVVLAGCASSGGGSSSPAKSSSTAKSKKIAFLLPQNGVPRFESWDKPFFEQAIKAGCPNCQVLYYNAQNENAQLQQQQAEAALSNGAAVLVICPVDGQAAKAIADEAAAKNVPVVSYERLVLGSTDVKAFTTHDAVKVGELQAATLIQAMKDKGGVKPVLMVNGSPTTSDAQLFKKGATKGFESAGVKILASFDTPNWDPAKAQTQMDQWITKYGADAFGAVYAANDGTAGGVIAAMKAAGINPADHPVSGQDGDLTAIQRILTGDQDMTIFRPLKKEADLAAEAALALLNGQSLPSAFSTQTDNSSGRNVPSAVLSTVAVTKSNIKQELVDSGYFTVQQICTSQYQSACKAAGLTS